MKAPLVALSLFFVLSVPLFAYQTPKKTPTFAEESVPDGKALIYIYYPAGGGSPLFFSNSGPGYYRSWWMKKELGHTLRLLKPTQRVTEGGTYARKEVYANRGS